MSRSSRFLALMLSAALLSSGTARSTHARAADDPSPVNATIPAIVLLVANDGSGVPDPIGTFSVIHRDLANNPIPNAVIRIDLSHAPELRLCSQQQAGLHVECAPGVSYVEGRTDEQGTLTASLMGYGVGDAVTGLNGCRIYADGTLLGSPTVAAFDLSGADGVGANDFSVWFGDFGTGNPHGRSDYDNSGSIGANDLSIWFNVFGRGLSAVGCGTSCP